MRNRKTGTQKDRKTEGQKDRKTERQKDRKTERQKDRKTERQTDEKIKIQRKRKAIKMIIKFLLGLCKSRHHCHSGSERREGRSPLRRVNRKTSQ